MNKLRLKIKKRKAKIKWKSLSCSFIEEIDNKDLSQLGVLNIIQKIFDFQKKYGCKYINYSETRNITNYVSMKIQEIITSNHYDSNALEVLTQCVANPKIQKAIFDFSLSFEHQNSPEDYFKNNFWDIIISDKLKNTPQIDKIIDNICIWVSKKAFIYSNKYIPFKCGNKIRIKRQSFNCCAYFLTFFVCSLLFNYDANKGYKKYKDIICSFSNNPEIQFLLFYILYSILQNYIPMSITYYGKINNIDYDFTCQVKRDYNDFNFDGLTPKFEKSLKQNIHKIIFENCPASNFEFYCVIDYTLEEIAGEKLDTDELNPEELWNKIKAKSKEVFKK